MTRTRVVVKDDSGRARVSLLDDKGATLGVATMTWPQYQKSFQALMSLVMSQTRRSIAETLASMIWMDAQSVADGSAEFAKKLLADFGWNQEKIDKYSDHLTRELAQKLAELLPRIE